MCENGACAFNSSQCLNAVGCPKNIPIKCSDHGLCARNEIACKSLADAPSLTNGCSINNPYKCSDLEGDCAVNLEECNFEKKCPVNQVKCADDSCAANHTTCLEQAFNDDTPGTVLCPD